ncbi:MAG TPA: divergent polysaccharide deacetylase family protein [Vineibacter sp.]|nr:divergent polysaccharide deacetylase family protein [Vineibacter sp.]
MPRSIGAHLVAAVARIGKLGSAAWSAVGSRRLTVVTAAFALLLLLGLGGGYGLARLLVGGDDSRITAMSRAPASRSGSTPAPKYASIDDLPDLPRYSEAEGRRRPVYEERGPQLAMLGRPLPDVAWVRNAVAFADDRARPLIVIVIDDMGLDQARSRRVVDLPAPLTLSYLPYGRDLQGQTQAARGRGHELMLHLPMEPTSAALDPGPNALLTTLAEEAIRRRTIAALDSFTGYVAVNNHMGSRFTTWRPGVETALKELRARGVAWLDSRTHAHSVGGQVASELGMPYLDRHVFLDDVDSAEAVRQQLAETERIARQQGIAIAIGHPHDATIRALAEWLPGLRGKGFAQAPISAAFKRRGRWE